MRASDGLLNRAFLVPAAASGDLGPRTHVRNRTRERLACAPADAAYVEVRARRYRGPTIEPCSGADKINRDRPEGGSGGGIAVAPAARQLVDPLPSADHLSARLGDGSLRPALRLLHERGDELPAEARCSHAGGARPAVLGLRALRHAKLRLTGGEPLVRRDIMRPVPLAVAPSRQRRARRADAHHQRHAARPPCARTRRLRREARQRLARHARRRHVSAG